MQKLFRKFFYFIKNPLSGFIFYLICVSAFLYIPSKGHSTITLVFLLPVILSVVIGLNLSFLSVLFRRFTVSINKKQNHALEHGTIFFLKKRFGNKMRVGGLSEENGFRICGVPKKHDIVKAFQKFSREFYQHDPELFISLRCGSNIVTSQGFGIILLTISAITLKFLQASILTISIVLIANILIYFLLRNQLGNWVQEKLFMSTEFSNAKIHSINKVKKKIYWENNPVYFVKTIIE